MVGLISGHGEQVLVMGWILLENIFLGVVRCGRFGGLVMIVLLFLGGFETIFKCNAFTTTKTTTKKLTPTDTTLD